MGVIMFSVFLAVKYIFIYFLILYVFNGKKIKHTNYDNYNGYGDYDGCDSYDIYQDVDDVNNDFNY